MFPTIDSLRQCIREQLTPLITGDYVLLDCPYYANIGDTLIWEGELTFLRELPHRMLAYASFATWLFPPLDPGTVIILRGGGNFGDLWRWLQEFRLQVIEAYPDNPIVIFPQTVHYDDTALLLLDAQRMARHPRLVICARDQRTCDLLGQHFSNPILLVPDLAFYIDRQTMARWMSRRPSTLPLWFKRTDLELACEERPEEIPAEAAVRDWPTFERTTLTTWLIYKLSGLCVRLARVPRLAFLRRLLAWKTDLLGMYALRYGNFRTGVRFLSRYGAIYTTRLHGAILAILLGKEKIVLIDNSYGKNSGFYHTWLQGMPGVSLLGEKETSHNV